MADIPDWLRELENQSDPDAPEGCELTGGDCPGDSSGCSQCV